MKGIFIILVLINAFDICAGSTVYGCDLVGLNICAWELGQNISKITSENVYVIPSASDVRALCRYNDAFESCYKDKLSGCSNNIMYITSFAATRKTMKFLCLDAYESIISHDECWTQERVHKETHMCYHEHLRQIQRNLNKLREPHSALVDRAWCRMVSTSKACMHAIIRENCDSAAVTIIDHMMNSILEEISTYMSCDYQGQYMVPAQSLTAVAPHTQKQDCNVENSANTPAMALHFLTIILLLRQPFS